MSATEITDRLLHDLHFVEPARNAALKRICNRRSEIMDMPKGDKSKYSSKQKRQAEHIEEGYEKRGTSKGEAERRAWATVNKSSGGGKKSGSGRGKKTSNAPAKKGGGKATTKKKS